MLVEIRDLQLPIPKPNAPNTNMSKYYAYHQKNGHTLEECFVLKDKIYDLNDKGEIMWPALRDRLREVRARQHKLQIHQNPLPNHLVAQLEVMDSPSEAESEPVAIHLLESALELVPSVAENSEPDIQEMHSEQGSTKWEFQIGDTQEEENNANDLALLRHFNFLPGGEQPQELDNEADPFVPS